MRPRPLRIRLSPLLVRNPFWSPDPGRRGLLLAVTVALALPAAANAERPNIDRVTVGRDHSGVLTFRIHLARPVILDPDDTVQVAIDTDRDHVSGVHGLEFALDHTGMSALGTSALLTAVHGKPVESHPPALRFTSDEKGPFGLASSSMAFSIPASAIGDPHRFDFYVFARVDGEMDDAPQRGLLSHAFWTYPKKREIRAGETYPVETYNESPDTNSLHFPEHSGLVIALVAASLFGAGALAAFVGWGVEQRRRREGS